MKKTIRNIKTSITGTTDLLIDRLWKDYVLTPKDIVRANQVHLVCLWMLATSTEKHTYQHYVRSAIERLTIDHNIIHYCPYELRIDAWYFDSELNELEKQYITYSEDKIF